MKTRYLLSFAVLFAALALQAPPVAAQGVAAKNAPALGAGAPTSQASPFLFAFDNAKGEKFRALSVVDESVYVNHRFVRSTQILNRITYEIADVAADGAWGLLRGTFETSERPKDNSAYVIADSYDSEFTRDRQGHYTIDPKFYMPTVRDVPIFPDRALSPGESWSAPGEERHDFRRVFGIPDPYVIPIDVRYRFEGPVDRGGKKLLLVSATYTIFERPKEPRAYTDVFPVQIAGYSDQKIYWDPDLGQPLAYEERFDLSFDWSDGSNVEYKGSAQSEILESLRMDRESLKTEIEKGVAGMANVTVASTSEGVTISMQDIQFEPDSARLKDSELAKVAALAALLKGYPDRDILVCGYTAAAGFAAGRKKLSEDRAKAVADRLVVLGARLPSRIRATGRGDEAPIADNATEAGRARNRRVEITLLEN